MLAKRFFGCAAILGAVAVTTGMAGCAVGSDSGASASADDIDVTAPFLSVPRGDGSVATAANAKGVNLQSLRALADGQATGDGFYLAINKKELGERWFLSAFMKQFFPGAVNGGAARTLGTRIVTFKLQNDKLYVFEADDTKKSSDNFDPQVLVDAYPVVSGFRAFSLKKGADQFVLFDPSAGLAEFGVVSNDFGSSGVKYKEDLKYLQRFRKITDGVTYEQVFTGLVDPTGGETGGVATGQATPGDLEPNLLRASGTLGIALRRYVEGAGFTTPVMPQASDDPTKAEVDREYFFRAGLQIVPGTGTVKEYAAKWNIKPGMKPIKWIISDSINETQNNPTFKGYDVITAVKNGIEGWNDVFGFKVFEATVGSVNDSWADDDTNMLIWDLDPTAGFAFANWRSNPNTGETRGASVYLPSVFFDAYFGAFEDDATAAQPLVSMDDSKPLPHPVAKFINWGGMQEFRACELPAPQYRPNYRANLKSLANPDPKAPLTAKEKLLNFLTSTVSHEVGHTLGLRHNFAGSLAGTPGVSLMDYIDDFNAAPRAPFALDYDRAAVKFLYGIDKAPLPAATLPFCTDEDTVVDPTCNRFDIGTDPAGDYAIPAYFNRISLLALSFDKTGRVPASALEGFINRNTNTQLNNLEQYIRTTTALAPADAAALRDEAFSALLQLVGAPVKPVSADFDYPGWKTFADYAYKAAVKRLYLDAPETRGSFSADPPAADAAFQTKFLAEVKTSLTKDGGRSLETRRVLVDVLKKVQTTAALTVLKAARAAIVTEHDAATGDVATGLEDLTARIDRAITPYFD